MYIYLEYLKIYEIIAAATVDSTDENINDFESRKSLISLSISQLKYRIRQTDIHEYVRRPKIYILRLLAKHLNIILVICGSSSIE